MFKPPLVPKTLTTDNLVSLLELKTQKNCRAVCAYSGRLDRCLGRRIGGIADPLFAWELDRNSYLFAHYIRAYRQTSVVSSAFEKRFYRYSGHRVG